MRIIDQFDRGASLYPDRDCLNDGTRGWTYRTVQELTHRIAAGLRRDGIAAGGRISVYSPNHAMAYATVMAVGRHDGTWVPINARNAIDENLYILNNNRVEALFYHSDFEPLLDRIRAEVPSIRLFVCIDRAGGAAPFLDDWMPATWEPAPDDIVNPEAIFAHVSSGGTTGRPKGVMLSHRAFETMIATFHACMPVTEPPVHLMVAPMTHAAGVTSFALLAYGATNVFLPDTKPETIMAAIEKHRVTHLFLPPTLIYVILAHPDVRKYDYSSLRNFVYAAAPMSADKLKEALEVFGPVMTQTYGQAEAPMIATFFSPAEHMEALRTNKHHRLLSCGKSTPYTRVEIMDDDGNILPRGESGEIVVRGSLVMSGYFGQPDETAAAGTFGWHHTGDIGTIDEDGFVYIVDRKKDMIITGGFNVYPSEIEQVLWTHPAVQDCAVIGVPDEKWGEAVKAVVELKPGASTDGAELIALCKEKLGSVKAPKTVDFIDQLPRSPVGKVLKRDLRKPFWEGKGRAVG
ncbi:MAG: AMP-binding protein [Pseudomonadota bacterium]|nr:AMP-binding protein [Pseudomonadota bacterium]